MGYLRTDRRTPALNIPNKPGVTYPHGDFAYPQIVENSTASKATDFPALLSAHDRTDIYPNAKLIAVTNEPGDNRSANQHEVYRTLPGPRIWKPGFNTELGSATSEYRQEVAMPASIDIPGSSITNPLGVSQLVLDSWIEPFNESTVIGTKITECITMPPARTEYESIGYEFPAIFAFIGGWAIPAPAGFQTRGPYAGVNFTLTAHRTASSPAAVAIGYSNGFPGSIPPVYTVTTPGFADRFFGIGANTVHNAIFLQETETAGVITVEDLPASTPSSYSPGTTLTIRASSRLVKGTLWETRITSVTE